MEDKGYLQTDVRRECKIFCISIIAATFLLLEACVSLSRTLPSSAGNEDKSCRSEEVGRETIDGMNGQQPQTSPRRKDRPSRVHVSFGVGYSQRNGLKQAMSELDRAGLGVDYTDNGWFSTGPGFFQGEWRDFQRNNPFGHSDHRVGFGDLRLDYSVTRRWALGVLFTPLGQYTISGGKEIPVGDGMEGIQMSAEYKGQASFLTISFFPLRNGYSRRSGIQLQAGVGLNRLRYTYYDHGGADGTSARRSSLCALIRTEYGIFLNRHWSFNFAVHYRYAPVHLPGTFFENDDYSFSQSLDFHWREVFPAITADMGGVGYGISLGFHF